jgi:hypothetical protein
MRPNDPLPVRSPVAFDDADVRAADGLIDRFGTLAAILLPDAPQDRRTIKRVLSLARGANAVLARGHAADGLHVEDLAYEANYASDKHVREGLEGPWPRQWAALTIRLMTASATPVLADQICTAPAPVRRESRRAGYDSTPHMAKIKPLLRVHLAAADRHLLDWQHALVARTSWDRESVEPDFDAINALEEALGEQLPASLADHMRLALDERADCRSVLLEAVHAHPELFLEAELDPESVVDHAFPDLAILAPLPHGSPKVEGESFSHMVMPGDDDQLVGLAARSGLSGIAACTLRSDPRSPQRPLALDVRTASIWGLTAPSWSVAFRAYGDDGILRVDRTGGGARAFMYRVFGMSVDDPRAVALVQRAAETWAEDCAARADSASPPGKVYAKDPAFRRAVLAIVAVADAAHVNAERARRGGRA